jgi:hypothetical protein
MGIDNEPAKGQPDSPLGTMTDPDHKRGKRWVQGGGLCPDCGSDDVFWDHEGGGCNSCFTAFTFNR